MTIEQTVEIPPSRRVTLDLPSSFPVGRFKSAFVLFPEEPELSAAERKALAEEPLPRVTRTEREEWAKDPVIQFLDQPVELDWSWLPEGKTPETVTKEDFRALAIKEKYGI